MCVQNATKRHTKHEVEYRLVQQLLFHEQQRAGSCLAAQLVSNALLPNFSYNLQNQPTIVARCESVFTSNNPTILDENLTSFALSNTTQAAAKLKKDPTYFIFRVPDVHILLFCSVRIV